MSPPAATAVRDRLRIAIQKGGRLSAPARALLASCGLTWRESGDRLFCYGESLPIDLLLVRDDDIPGLIADGICDLGIVGRNVLEEHSAARQLACCPAGGRELRALGFGACRLDIAVPEAWQWQGPQQLQASRIATSHPFLVRRWLREQDIEAEVVTLSGSVEIAPRLGQADVVCDLVSSGATLAANQLKPVMTVLRSEAVLAGPAVDAMDARGELTRLLLRRMDGVMKIRDSRLLIFHARRDAVAGVMELLVDAESPTMTQLDGSDSVALQALCHGEMTWQRLEDLKRAGARGLLVLPIERMLA